MRGQRCVGVVALAAAGERKRERGRGFVEKIAPSLVLSFFLFFRTIASFI